MNPLNTELIWFGSRTNLQNLALMPGTSSLTVTRDVVQSENAVCDLGVTLNSELSMQNHVNEVARTCFYHILRLKQVRKLLGPDIAAKLVPSLVFSRLEYCNAILAGLSRSTIAPLLRVQNAAARLVARVGQHDHVTLTLKDRAHRRANRVHILFADAPSSYRTSAILTSKLCHHVSRQHLMSSSALHQQLTIRMAAPMSEVRRTFVFVCQTKSLEQCAIITA